LKSNAQDVIQGDPKKISDTQLFIQGGAKKMKSNAQDIIGWSEKLTWVWNTGWS